MGDVGTLIFRSTGQGHSWIQQWISIDTFRCDNITSIKIRILISNGFTLQVEMRCRDLFWVFHSISYRFNNREFVKVEEFERNLII